MKSNFTLLLITWLVSQFYISSLNAQSCCDNDNTTTLCYLSAADFCTTTDSYCYAYSLDGEFMEPGLTQKLLNPANYGAGGIVSCNIDLVKLDLPITVQSINDQGCDIVFLGSVTVDPITQVSDPRESYVPLPVLEAINEWSVLCSNNLVVASQGETTVWGYSLENENINPNTPLTGTSLASIFDGPFGSITSFNQGGSFQGVFTGTPSTGFEILAKDELDRPTVALDLATNDLVVGDIGIFCTGPGDVSPGPDIITNNDVLACNIFALACLLADDVETSEQAFEICPNESVTLPGGDVVSDIGVYSDTLASWTGCDSVIITTITAKTIANTQLNTKHCVGDGYSIVVNGNTYNEANPIGLEQLTTSGGCDSTVIIALQFNQHTAQTIDPILCVGESIPLNIGGVADAPGTYLDTLTNFNGCDSVLTINLDFHPVDTSFLVKQLCPGETATVGGQIFQAGQTSSISLPDQFGCDSFIVTNYLLFPAPNAQIDSAVEVTQSNFTPFSNSIQGDYLIKWLENQALSCDDCPNPVVLSNDGISLFNLTLTDSIGCLWNYPIYVTYICNSFIPNAFTPNFDGINDEFTRFSSGCPVQEYQFQVFDRWGEMVFSTDDPAIGWDGYHNGKPANLGTYVFLITVTEYGHKKQFTGELNLLR